MLPSDNHKIVIRANKTSTGEYNGRFNAPMLNEDVIRLFKRIWNLVTSLFNDVMVAIFSGSEKHIVDMTQYTYI